MAIRLKPPYQTDTGTGQHRHRFQLVKFVLIIILLSVLGIGVILVRTNFDAAFSNISDAAFSMNQQTADSMQHIETLCCRHQLELAGIAQEEKKELRAFFLEICQIVLLHLMLPILTATLGYNMGKARAD